MDESVKECCASLNYAIRYIEESRNKLAKKPVVDAELLRRVNALHRQAQDLWCIAFNRHAGESNATS